MKVGHSSVMPVNMICLWSQCSYGKMDAHRPANLTCTVVSNKREMRPSHSKPRTTFSAVLWFPHVCLCSEEPRVVHTCNLSTKRQRQEDPWGLQAGQPNLVGCFQATEWLCLKKKKKVNGAWEITKAVLQPPHACTVSANVHKDWVLYRPSGSEFLKLTALVSF